MNGIKRSCFKTLKIMLEHFPCVAIVGARQTGKTTLLKQIFPKIPFYDLEKQSDYNRISRDPDFFLSQCDQPVVLDEAQLLPSLFPALRVAIDAQRKKNGRFLISGSSSPDLLSNISESLAGRIAIFELSGFCLEESWRKSRNPVYKYLSDGNIEGLLSLKPRLSTKQLFESCLYGAYPEPFLKHRHNQSIFSLWMENYFQTYINRDIRALFPTLNIRAYQRFVTMLAGSSGNTLNASEFARSVEVSQPTIKLYSQIAHGTFVWRMIQSYQKSIHKRVVKAPKGYMRDSGLVNFILQNRSLESLQMHPAFGRIWEGFIVEEILKGFGNNLISVKPFHYRTTNQAEIDLILEGAFDVMPIEIKAGTLTSSKSLIALKQFINERNLPYGFIINNSQEVAWLDKKILQIPASCL